MVHDTPISMLTVIVRDTPENDKIEHVYYSTKQEWCDSINSSTTATILYNTPLLLYNQSLPSYVSQ